MPPSRDELRARLRAKCRERRADAGPRSRDDVRNSVETTLMSSVDDPALLRLAQGMLKNPALLRRAVRDSAAVRKDDEEEAPPPLPTPSADDDDEEAPPPLPEPPAREEDDEESPPPLPEPPEEEEAPPRPAR